MSAVQLPANCMQRPHQLTLGAELGAMPLQLQLLVEMTQTDRSTKSDVFEVLIAVEYNANRRTVTGNFGPFAVASGNKAGGCHGYSRINVA
jgi:hypothetical protein